MLSRRHVIRLAVAAGTLPLARTVFAADWPTVTAGVLGVTSSIWPALVAQEKGYFKEAGIDFELVTTGQSARAAQQVAAGAVDIGCSSMVDAFRAIDGGGGLKVFLNSQAVGTHSLLAAKTIKSVPELKGKRVMTGGQKDVTNLWWQAMARHFGLDPVNDVELLYSGSSGARLAALIAGGVDATVLSPPQSFRAAAEGYTDLGPVATYTGEFPMMVWHANVGWAQGHEKEMQAFVAAHNRAATYINDPKNRQEAAAILAKASNSSLEDALETWDISAKVKAYVDNGAISDQAVKRVIETLVSDGDLKTPVKPAASFIDERYMRAAK
jgi:NitT/TauT family transport system substrate-binding protein